MTFKPITHVIFDLDGTLLDTEVVYQKVLSEMAVFHGKEYTEQLRMKVLGTTEPDTAKIFVKELGLDGKLSTTEFLKDYKERSVKALPGLKLMDGTERLIRHLHKHNVPFAIATSSSDGMVKIKTAHLMELFDLFNHKVMGSSDPAVKHGKPAPDIYLICASRFEPPADPSKCLVFEDAPNGATGAVAAGMQVVAVPDARVPKDLFPKETCVILESMEQFKPLDFGLPAYD